MLLVVIILLDNLHLVLKQDGRAALGLERLYSHQPQELLLPLLQDTGTGEVDAWGGGCLMCVMFLMAHEENVVCLSTPQP